MQDSMATPLGETTAKARSVAGARSASKGKTKFIVGGVLILAAVIYLIVSQMGAGASYFMTIKELQAKKAEYIGKSVRVSGVVLGDTIQPYTGDLELRFTVAHIPGTQQELDAMGGMAAALHTAAIDPTLPRMVVVYHGPKPDLLKNEAQAIMTGKLMADGTFQADELLLKCPTKYQDAVPSQVAGASN